MTCANLYHSWTYTTALQQHDRTGRTQDWHRELMTRTERWQSSLGKHYKRICMECCFSVPQRREIQFAIAEFLGLRSPFVRC